MGDALAVDTTALPWAPAPGDVKDHGHPTRGADETVSTATAPARRRTRKTMVFAASGIALAAAAAGLVLVLTHGKAGAPPIAAKPIVVRSLLVAPAAPGHARFTGVVHARYESNLGFRVSGKILERLVDPGDHVRAGQPLLRLDETDLALAVRAAHSAVEATQATSAQATSDERRRRVLMSEGWVSRQTYELNKSAADSSVAQLASALSQEHQAEDQLSYAVLRADADGVIMSVPGEPGQVVAAGQAVVQLAHDGSREAEVYLPEGEERAAHAAATADLYTKVDTSYQATLRELSAMADPATRTYRARYVLDGAGKDAPLGATVTVSLSEPQKRLFSVPVGAIFDNGNGPGVWVIDPTSREVKRAPIVVASVGEERALVKDGLKGGEEVVALGAQMLRSGEKVAVDTAPLDTAAR